MHFTPRPRWLMIASMATVVLPVLRSPMISWRWPRPIGVIASIALMPVCSGCFTRCRGLTFDAATEVRVTDRHREHPAGPLDLLALVDAGELAEHHDADLPDVEVQRDAERPVLEPHEL